MEEFKDSDGHSVELEKFISRHVQNLCEDLNRNREIDRPNAVICICISMIATLGANEKIPPMMIEQMGIMIGENAAKSVSKFKRNMSQ